MSVENQIVAAIRRIMRAVELHSRHLSDEHGLTGPQVAVLQSAASLGQASIGTIARQVHLSSATVTGILDRLERRGLVIRGKDDRDRRTVIVTATPRGYEMLQSSPSLLQDRFRERLAGLEEWEQNMILATLQRIAAMMDAESLDASPVLVSGSVHEFAEEAGASSTRLEASQEADSRLLPIDFEEPRSR